MKAPSTPRDISPEESLIEYPCDFTVKVMGAASSEFKSKIIEITRSHDSEFNDTKVSEKHSKNNKYLSLSLKISAQNREQLDALYTDLTACELTLWVL